MHRRPNGPTKHLSVVMPSVPAMTTGTRHPADQLDDTERAILDFERHWWKYAGAKETAVREHFDMSSTRYYQVVNALIDRPAALAHDPMTVRRLQRLREARRGRRSGRVGVDRSTHLPL